MRRSVHPGQVRGFQLVEHLGRGGADPMWGERDYQPAQFRVPGYALLSALWPVAEPVPLRRVDLDNKSGLGPTAVGNDPPLGSSRPVSGQRPVPARLGQDAAPFDQIPEFALRRRPATRQHVGHRTSGGGEAAVRTGFQFTHQVGDRRAAALDDLAQHSASVAQQPGLRTGRQTIRVLRDHGQAFESDRVHSRPTLWRKAKRPAPGMIGQRITLVIARWFRLELSTSDRRVVLPDNDSLGGRPRGSVEAHKVRIRTLPPKVNENIDDAVRIRPLLQAAHPAGHRTSDQRAAPGIEHSGPPTVDVGEWAGECRVHAREHDLPPAPNGASDCTGGHPRCQDLLPGDKPILSMGNAEDPSRGH